MPDQTGLDTDFPPESRGAKALRLRILREAFGYAKQSDWCDFVGIAQSAWSQYERGKYEISTKDAHALCHKVLGMSFDWIYRGNELSIPANYRELVQAVRDQRRRRREIKLVANGN